MIEQYTKQLLEMGKLHGGEAAPATVEDEKVEVPAKKASEDEAPSEKETFQQPPEINEEENIYENKADALSQEDIGEIIRQQEEKKTMLENELENQTQLNDTAEEEKLSSQASFVARVFAGENIYPVADAKVIIYQGDKIFAFVTTDENGSTKKITLPAYPMQNSLEAENTEQTSDYMADVFAPGFVPKKGILVSTVGESEVILDVFMTPESERIN